MTFDPELATRSSALQFFQSMRERRLYERRELPSLKTLADFDICHEIGFHQLSGSPLTVKHLLLLGIAPAVTVFRRLDRLYRLDIVSGVQSQRDRRVHELRLTPAMLRLFGKYAGNCAQTEERLALEACIPAFDTAVQRGNRPFRQNREGESDKEKASNDVLQHG